MKEVAITNNIKIAVEPTFQPEFSNNTQQIFSYKIKITNCSPSTVQLLNRHWMIFDGFGRLKEVEGEGVVGEQPVLAPGEMFEYQSWCPLATEIGKMGGSFEMKRLDSGDLFLVKVPNFMMVTPWLLN